MWCEEAKDDGTSSPHKGHGSIVIGRGEQDASMKPVRQDSSFMCTSR